MMFEEQMVNLVISIFMSHRRRGGRAEKLQSSPDILVEKTVINFIYDQPHNESFCDNLEKLQYNWCYKREHLSWKLDEKLGLESLEFKRWMCRFCVFYKIKTRDLHLIPAKISSYNTRNSDHIKTYYCRTDIFRYLLFPYTIVAWKRLDHTLCNSKSYDVFKNSLLKIGRPMPKPAFNIHNSLVLKLLIRLRLGLSHLNKRSLIIILRIA